MRPDGAPDAAASTTPQIRLFDTATLNCTANLSGHSDAVLAMDARPLGVGAAAGGASADTTLLVSAAKDRTIRLWSAPSGRCLGGCSHEPALLSKHLAYLQIIPPFQAFHFPQRRPSWHCCR